MLKTLLTLNPRRCSPWTGHTARGVLLPVLAGVVLSIAGLLGLAGHSGAMSTALCDAPAADAPLEAVEQALIGEINDYRTALGLANVSESPSLRRAAMWKSQDRAEGGPETHDDPTRSWHKRLNDCGYTLDAEKGENLANFEGDIPLADEPAMLVSAWKNSPGHDKVLTDPSYRVVGVARVRVPGTFRTYWTADFGSIPD